MTTVTVSCVVVGASAAISLISIVLPDEDSAATRLELNVAPKADVSLSVSLALVASSADVVYISYSILRSFPCASLRAAGSGLGTNFKLVAFTLEQSTVMADATEHSTFVLKVFVFTVASSSPDTSMVSADLTV
jgi:hypothetical protein